jgi:flagellar motility protein MotE (MotC chaperone)
MSKIARRGFRPVDGVVIAAVALLGLKVLGIISWMGAPAEPPPKPGALPPFARVLAYARSNEYDRDVSTTGSVPEKKDEKPTEPSGSGTAPPAGAPSGLPSAGAAAPVPLPSGSPSERLILERLGERRDELRQKAQEAEARERLLEESERRLDSRLGELKALQQKVESTAEKKVQAEVEGLKNLVTMYEAMKPKDAARVFDRLPQAVLVPVVQQMNPRKMSEVLAAMNPASAEKLTVALASQGKEATPGAVAAALPAGELPDLAPAPKR